MEDSVETKRSQKWPKKPRFWGQKYLKSIFSAPETSNRLENVFLGISIFLIWKSDRDFFFENCDFFSKIVTFVTFFENCDFCDFFWKIVTLSHDWSHKSHDWSHKSHDSWLEVTIFEKKSQFSKKKSRSLQKFKKIEIPKNTFSSRLLVSGALKSIFKFFWPLNRDFFGHFWYHFFSNFWRKQN